MPCEPGITGAPILAGALAVLECQIAQEVPGGSHRVLLANVVRASAGEGSPLAYFRGRFGRIELIQDAEAYRRLRDLILTRQVSADERLDVERLAGQLKTSPSAVQYALTRLVTENLVIREDRGHVVKPLDVATSNEAHDARMAIELGVAEMTVGISAQASCPSCGDWPRPRSTSSAGVIQTVSAPTRWPTRSSTASWWPPRGWMRFPPSMSSSASPT